MNGKFKANSPILQIFFLQNVNRANPFDIKWLLPDSDVNEEK
jgi:hypothetical protein